MPSNLNYFVHVVQHVMSLYVLKSGDDLNVSMFAFLLEGLYVMMCSWLFWVDTGV